MNTLEVIHLRFSGVGPELLAESIRDAVEPFSEGTRINIYRHNRVDTDLVVHLHREEDKEECPRSRLGTQLASMLRRYGIVEHSMWVEALTMGDPSASRTRS